ncbi:MAG: LysR family transcriptional regulator [Burkholderiaceae bacterium]
MRLRYIEIFHAVMQAGTVKGAAELLHITQPAASRLLQQAEANLGTPLFQRDRGRLLPTQEAIILRPEIEQLHARLDEVRRIATTLADGEDVSLKVLSEPALAVEFLPAACARLMRRKPRLKLTVHTLHTRQLSESLALREAHIGFAFAPSSHPAIASSPVAEADLVCVGLDLPDGPMSLEQAVSGPVVDLAPDDPLREILHRAVDALDLSMNSSAFVHSYHAAIEFAHQGLGRAIVDRFSARYASRYPRLRVRPIVPAIPMTVYCLRPTGLPSNASATLLAELLAEGLRAG